MLHDRGADAALGGHRDAIAFAGPRADEQPQRRVEIEQVVVRQGLAPELLRQFEFARQVERGTVLRVLPVAQRLLDRDRQRERAGEFVCDQPGFEIPRDRAIVLGRAFEGDRRITAARRVVEAAATQRVDERAVLQRVAQDGDVIEILGRRTQQRNAADIDLLDRFAQRRAVARNRRFERVQVRDNRRNRGDRVFARFGDVRGIGAVLEDAAEDVGMQRLDAAVEERRVAGQIADVEGVDSGLAQVRACAARRVDRNAALAKRARQRHDPGPVVDRDEGRVAGFRHCARSAAPEPARPPAAATRSRPDPSRRAAALRARRSRSNSRPVPAS